MQQEFDVTDIKPGMFIVEVVSQTGALKIKSQGLIKSSRAVQTLMQKGVKTVLVDLARSQLAEPKKEPEVAETLPPQEVVKPAAKAKKPAVTFEKEIGKASQLFNQAKQIQQSSFANVKAGKAVDAGPVRAHAEQMVDSVFRNSDALACMTRMKSKNDYLIEHSINCAILMAVFARHLKLEHPLLNDLVTASMLADIGMIAVPDDLLVKTTPLVEQEFEQIKRHVELGTSVLAKSSALGDAGLDIVANHQERLDGSGYPKGLKGDDISLYSKMFAIVDSYDAMTTERPHKASRTPMQAFKELRQNDHLYDRDLVDDFIKCLGIHPVGTIVRLTNNKLGIVVKSNPGDPLKPKVNVFYSVVNKSYIEPKIIDLSSSRVTEEIERSVRPEDFQLDMIRFFKQVLLA